MSLPLRISKLFPLRPRIEPQMRIKQRVRIPCGERWLIDYNVASGERARAFLLVPDVSSKRVPGIIASHQHNGEYEIGKSETAGLRGDPEMAYGLELCARGFAVLCPDHFGFEDRQQKKIRGQFPLKGKNYEQFLFTDALLRGGSLTATCLFDLQQGLDVLAGLDFVHRDRLGVVGHSLGGQTALWLAAADRRVRVGFSSCGFSMLELIQRLHRPHNCAICLPGLLRVGDMDDVVASIAPRAFGMSHGLLDHSFPIAGVRKIHRRAETQFEDGSLLKILFRGGHAFPPPIREKAYAFLGAHLDGVNLN